MGKLLSLLLITMLTLTQNPIINIYGGIGCHISITNNENKSLRAIWNISYDKTHKEGIVEVKPHSTTIINIPVFSLFSKINIKVYVDGQLYEKDGYVILCFVICK